MGVRPRSAARCKAATKREEQDGAAGSAHAPRHTMSPTLHHRLDFGLDAGWVGIIYNPTQSFGLGSNKITRIITIIIIVNLFEDFIE